MTLVNLVIRRCISTTRTNYGKRNFRKFPLYNKRGTKIFKQQQMENPDPAVPVHKMGVRDIGYEENGKFVAIPEMIPQLIVPDLTNFHLKPYVSYRTPDVIQSEFTAKDLFNVVYAPKIADDFKKNKLNDDGSPKEPSAEEMLQPEEAKLKARQTGSDLFCPKEA